MKNIKWTPKSYGAEMLATRPKPARHYIPEWYLKTPMFDTKKEKISAQGKADPSVRACMSFSDSFQMGYIQETWCDILVTPDSNGGANLVASMTNPPLIIQRKGMSYKIPNDYYQVDVSWQLQWIPKLPKGYSMIYTSPLNREDLPFTTVSGVVDNDVFFYENAANYPFMVKKGFEGIIPAGTPFMQMIPFKRDEWKSEYKEHVMKNQLLANKINSTFWGAYRKNFWIKKTFK